MARAENGATATTSLSDNLLSRTCRRLRVTCDSGSAQPVRFRVQNAQGDNIHDTGEYIELAAGESEVFDASVENQISDLRVQTGSSTGTYSWTVTG